MYQFLYALKACKKTGSNTVQWSKKKQRKRTKLPSVIEVRSNGHQSNSGHRFPMLYFSRRVDMRGQDESSASRGPKPSHLIIYHQVHKKRDTFKLLLRIKKLVRSGKSSIGQKECDQPGPFPIIPLEVTAV